MRCADLTATWTQLATWFESRDVLVLPPLVAQLPLVRLDADADATGDADVAVGRLRRLIEHFDVRVVYAERLTVVPPGGDSPEIAVLTVRALVAGAVHELRLFAGWYVELLDSEVGAEAAALR
ncbi:MAG TPA: hypothetical protein VHV74_27490 [Pseudonocardiaceae bacterium]|jgi:hypothetical protein|nr:hypothetical protein [Pseudonocardiaceae bacterium]